MKKILLISTMCVVVLVFSGCIAAWMTASTGKKLELHEGMARGDVIKLLGEPKERRSDYSNVVRHQFMYLRRPVTFAEVFEYKGKINAADEGGGQATIGALTLGVGEIFMIPMTAVDIAKRSLETNLIYVLFDGSEKVIGFIVNPVLKKEPN